VYRLRYKELWKKIANTVTAENYRTKVGIMFYDKGAKKKFLFCVTFSIFVTLRN
jgi:hypothetical protein